MEMHAVVSDQLDIVEIANLNGCMAVIEDEKVALFVPVLTEVGEGFHHVGFRIHHVYTVPQARKVLKSMKARRQQLEEHGHHFMLHSSAAANEPG